MWSLSDEIHSDVWCNLNSNFQSSEKPHCNSTGWDQSFWEVKVQKSCNLEALFLLSSVQIYMNRICTPTFCHQTSPTLGKIITKYIQFYLVHFFNPYSTSLPPTCCWLGRIFVLGHPPPRGHRWSPFRHLYSCRSLHSASVNGARLRNSVVGLDVLLENWLMWELGLSWGKFPFFIFFYFKTKVCIYIYNEISISKYM